MCLIFLPFHLLLCQYSKGTLCMNQKQGERQESVMLSLFMLSISYARDSNSFPAFGPCSSLNFMFSHTSLADFKILEVSSHLPPASGSWPNFGHLASERDVRTFSMQVGQLFLLLSKASFSSSTMQYFHSLWLGKLPFLQICINCNHVDSYPKDNVRSNSVIYS